MTIINQATYYPRRFPFVSANSKLLAVFAVCLAAGLVLFETPAVQGRTWSSKSGTYKIEAEYVGVEEDRVILRLLDGSVTEPKIAALSQVDQEYIKRKQPKNKVKEKNPSAKVTSSDKDNGKTKPTGKKRELNAGDSPPDEDNVKATSPKASTGSTSAQIAADYRGYLESGGYGSPDNLRRSRERFIRQEYLKKNAETKIAAWKTAAEAGSPEGQFLLAKCYYEGVSVPKDEAEAVKWYRKAAEQGDRIAQSQFGIQNLFLSGDIHQSIKSWHEIAEQGNMDGVDAQHNLGVCYHWGLGVTQDSTEAVKWYSKSAIGTTIIGSTILKSLESSTSPGRLKTGNEEAIESFVKKAAIEKFTERLARLKTGNEEAIKALNAPESLNKHTLPK